MSRFSFGEEDGVVAFHYGILYDLFISNVVYISEGSDDNKINHLIYELNDWYNKICNLKNEKIKLVE